MSDLKLPKIHVNAEFQRLWWTHVRWGLLVGVVLVFGLFAMTKDEYTSWHNHFTTLGSIGMLISAFAGYILLERSLKQDITSNTFDQLRMSSLSAWQMAWARIVVAPLVAWLGFALSWLAFLLGELGAADDSRSAIVFVLGLPFFAWGIACLVLANALPTSRDTRQWSGTTIQLILLFISGMCWLTYLADALHDIKFDNTTLYHGLWLEFGEMKTPITFVLFAAMASVFVWARTANVLHLRSVDKIYAVLAVLSPVLGWWSWGNWQIAATTTTLVYGGVALVSLAVQGTAINRFRLPAWVVVAPLGVVAALMLSVDVAMVWLQVVVLGVILATVTRLRLGVNSVTVGLSAYVLAHMLWAIVK